MSTCVIFNPTARGDKAAKFRRHIGEIRPDWTLQPTTGPGAGRQLACQAVLEGFSTIIAAGGDGTLNEVLNGIVDAPGGLSKVRLAILPIGTINVFARELNLPFDLKQACSVLDYGREISIDLPIAEFQLDGKTVTRAFTQLAGAGWDARSIQLVNWNLKKRIGPAAYVFAGLQALNSEHPPITISNGSESFTGQCVVVGNGKFYGGSFPVFHKSDYQDGVLDACIFTDINWLQLPAHLWNWWSGRLYKPGGSVYMQGREFFLSSPGQVIMQLEGEVVGELPARMTVKPRALRVVVPS